MWTPSYFDASGDRWLSIRPAAIGAAVLDRLSLLKYPQCPRLPHLHSSIGRAGKCLAESSTPTQGLRLACDESSPQVSRRRCQMMSHFCYQEVRGDVGGQPLCQSRGRKRGILPVDGEYACAHNEHENTLPHENRVDVGPNGWIFTHFSYNGNKRNYHHRWTDHRRSLVDGITALGFMVDNTHKE